MANDWEWKWSNFTLVCDLETWILRLIMLCTVKRLDKLFHLIFPVLDFAIEVFVPWSIVCIKKFIDSPLDVTKLSLDLMICDVDFVSSFDCFYRQVFNCRLIFTSSRYVQVVKEISFCRSMLTHRSYLSHVHKIASSKWILSNPNPRTSSLSEGRISNSRNDWNFQLENVNNQIGIDNSCLSQLKV